MQRFKFSDGCFTFGIEMSVDIYCQLHQTLKDELMRMKVLTSIFNLAGQETSEWRDEIRAGVTTSD